MSFQENSEQSAEIDPYLTLSENDRIELISTFAEIMQVVGKEPFENIPESNNVIIGRNLELLFDKYPPEAVWDQFIYFTNEHFYNPDDSQKPTFCSNARHERHARMVEEAENGSTETCPNSFGLFEPSYQLALQDSREELRDRPDLHALLLGSYGPTSGEEFDHFMDDINPNSTNTVINLSEEGIKRINRDMGRIQGDVTQLPIKSESQDLIFTNFLIPFLYKGEGPLPKGKFIIQMIKEAARALKPGGKLVLCEGLFTFKLIGNSFILFEDDLSELFKARNEMTTMTMYLLLTTLKRNGFGRRDIMYSQSYKTHRDKMDKDPKEIIEQRAKYIDENDNPTGEQEHFLYTITSTKGPEKHE